jgi:hypothetical protein
MNKFKARLDLWVSTSNENRLDIFHHKLNNLTTQKLKELLRLIAKLWNAKRDGFPMVDYSSQEPNGLPGCIIRKQLIWKISGCSWDRPNPLI